MKAVLTESAPRPVGPYSQAIAQGGLVFVSGQIPIDPATNALVPGGIEVQTERVLDNLAAVLDAAGSSLRRVVRTTIYVTDISLFARVNEVYARYFDADPPPARATVEVGALPLGARIEIDAIATTAAGAPDRPGARADAG